MTLSQDEVTARLRTAGCVYAEEEARLLLAQACDPVERARLVDRRILGEPLEYVLGWAEFRGLRIAVKAGVFIPRARTGLLVEQALLGLTPGAIVVDLCCGSGAIGAALAATVADLRLYAADIDSTAVRCARRNLTAPGQVVLEGDLFDPLPIGIRSKVEMITANTPYVPTGQIALMPREARDYEPLITLDGGPDGLDLQRRVAAPAASWLRPSGRLLMEISEQQAETASGILAAAGLTPAIARDDKLDGTVIIGTAAA